MSDVEKSREALVPCCLNNLYGCYASLQTFFTYFFIFRLFNNEKTRKKKQNNSQDHLIKHLKIF